MNADFQTLLQPWSLRFERERPEIPLEGSPERALSRTVIEDDQRRLFILERLAPETRARQLAIARALDALHRNGLTAITPYWAAQGQWIAPVAGAEWRLLPFLPSVKLNRATYAAESWRGSAMAAFLAALARAAAPFQAEPHFPFHQYAGRIAARLETEKPRAFRELSDVWKHLQTGLFARYDRLPMRFVHGDFHPLNILWTESGIRTVSD